MSFHGPIGYDALISPGEVSRLDPSPTEQDALLVRAGSRLCALPLEHVVETMRPLHVAPLASVPEYVLGVAVVRGEPVPVVDLDAFLGSNAAFAGNRFVIVRAGERHVALAVRDVLGVGNITSATSRAVPLLSRACDGAIESLAALDDELLVVLRLARLIPDRVRDALRARETIDVPEANA